MTHHSEKKWTLEDIKSFRKNSILETLGIEVQDCDDASIVLTMPITDAARQPLGILHGGVSLVLAETAASLHACWGIDLNELVPVGIEINGSHLNSADKGTVRAVARVLRKSRSLIVHQVEVVHVESDRVLCTSRVTNFYKSIKSLSGIA